MKIVAPSIVLEWVTPNALEVIELAGRTCYKSEPGSEPEGFARKLLKLGHESVLEHASASFRIICDRGISHEIVRHRLASYSQESTRYVNYGTRGGEIQVIEPSGMSEAIRYEWLAAMEDANHSYLEMLANGATPQVARSVLPTCTKTEIVMTCNFREWRHFLRLRTAPAAHPDMRNVAKMILTWFRKNVPVIVEDLKVTGETI
jgi:thymidylate synthase (FAD)